jgi:Tfp pilus assembly protein PilO
MKNKYNHYLFIIAPMAIIFIIVFVSIKFLMPMITGINAKRNELSTAKDKLIRMQNKRTTLESIATVDPQLLNDATLALPNEKDPETILNSIEKISALTQFSIDSIVLNPGLIATVSATSADAQVVNTNRGAQYLPLSIKATGLISGIPNFISILQNSRRLFDITNISLDFSSSTSETTTVTLSIVAYYLPAVEAIGAVDADLPKITDKEQKILLSLAQMPDTTEISTSTISGQMTTSKTNLFAW